MLKKETENKKPRGTISDQDYEKMVSWYFIAAKLYKDKFDAFKSVGFTDHQSFELIKVKGLFEK